GLDVRDVDTLIKPQTLGFAEETILRSERSPEALYFKVTMPDRAHLLHASGSNEVRVIDAGRVLASIAAPEAQDSEGTPIPLSLGVRAHTLTLKLKRHPGEYKLPIAVDPGITDWQLNVEGVKPTNWHYEHSAGTAFTASENPEGKGWTEHIAGNHSASEWGAM